MTTLHGSCLCGGIRFEISGPADGIVQCYCSLCRKSSGAGGIAKINVAADQLTWRAGEELVKTFARPSGYGSAFCAVCGSPAPDANAKRTRYDIPVGLLDGNPLLRVAEHIYVGSKAPWVTIADGAPQHDTM